MNINDSFDTRIARASSSENDIKDAKDTKDTKDTKDSNISIKESFSLLCNMIHGEDSTYMKNILIDIDEPNVKIQLIKMYLFNFRSNPVLSLIDVLLITEKIYKIINDNSYIFHRPYLHNLIFSKFDESIFEEIKQIILSDTRTLISSYMETLFDNTSDNIKPYNPDFFSLPFSEKKTENSYEYRCYNSEPNFLSESLNKSLDEKLILSNPMFKHLFKSNESSKWCCIKVSTYENIKSIIMLYNVKNILSYLFQFEKTCEKIMDKVNKISFYNTICSNISRNYGICSLVNISISSNISNNYTKKEFINNYENMLEMCDEIFEIEFFSNILISKNYILLNKILELLFNTIRYSLLKKFNNLFRLGVNNYTENFRVFKYLMMNIIDNSGIELTEIITIIKEEIISYVYNKTEEIFNETKPKNELLISRTLFCLKDKEYYLDFETVELLWDFVEAPLVEVDNNVHNNIYHNNHIENNEELYQELEEDIYI
jgi:hypothetical protein